MSWIGDILRRRRPIGEAVQDIVQFIAKSVNKGKPTIVTTARNAFSSSSVINFKEVDDAYKNDAYIRRAVDKYVHLLFKEGWNMVGKKDQAVNYIKSRFDLMAAVTNVPTDVFMVNIAHDLVEFHNVFLVKARVKGGFTYSGVKAQSTNPRGPVGAYFRVVPDEITPQYDERGDIKSYRQSVGTTNREFKPEDVIHIYMNKLPNEFYATPNVSCMLDDAKLLRQIEDNVGMMIYRHLFPLLQYTVGNGTPGSGASQPEIETLRTEIMNMPDDGAFVTTDRVKINAIKLSVINAEAYLKYFENRVFTGLGVSQVAMGRGDTASRATAESIIFDMYDQIKAYQKVMLAFVNQGMITELLQEGGYQPLTSPEYKVEMGFNEIDVDSLIKRQNHEVFKFVSNLQTWEETRKNLNMEATADEKRLYFNLVTIPVTAANAAAYNDDYTANAANRTEPKNQHSQSMHEMSGLQIKLETPSFSQFVTEDYRRLQHDVLGLLSDGRTYDKSQHEINGLTALTFQIITNRLVKEAMRSYQQGSEQAIADYNQAPLGTHALPTAMSTRVYLYMHNLQNDVKNMIEKAASKEQVVSIFDSTLYRLRSTVSDTIPRAYNVGYAMVARSLGVKTLTAVSAGDSCKGCESHDVSLEDLDIMSVPPWHHYCGCFLKAKGSD